MGLRFIRKPSETPDELNNVLNVDDIRMVRYAYGNQNGYIKGYGQELSHTIVGSTFMINSGIFVIQGAEIEITANGWGESVSGVTNKRYYIIYGEVNLSLQIAEIKSKYSHAAYPTIEAGDDLTQSTDGTARVLLYRFTATNGIISDVQKVIKGIDYSTEQIATVDTNIRTDLESGTLKAKIAEYASANVEKGTIEQRLTSLGFRQGNIVDTAGNVIGTVKRQGNYVICQGNGFGNGSGVNATIPIGFRPAKKEKIGVSGDFSAASQYPNNPISGGTYGYAYPNGELKIYVSNAIGRYLVVQYTRATFYGGWEASPL